MNESLVCKTLEGKGYLILDPSVLTPISQMSIFNTAKIIISPTGACLANLIFSKATTQIGILYSNGTNLDYNLWPKLSQATSKAKVSLLISKALQKKNMHSDCNVVLSELVDFVEQLERI